MGIPDKKTQVSPTVVVAGARVGSYVIVDALGAGGMGQVYRATDVRLGRSVALKFLHARFGNDPNEVARFQREAQVLASMNHPGIAAIYGLEECNGILVLVMELVEGPTLVERLANGRFTLEEKLRIARLMAEALDYAHKKGVMHRDLKPSNVMLTADDQVKLLDFGLARMFGGGAGAEAPDGEGLPPTKTEPGMIMGTFAYMSPEQAQGKPVDQRTDIWAFGAILYEMLAGRRLLEGETVFDLTASLATSLDFHAKA